MTNMDDRNFVLIRRITEDPKVTVIPTTQVIQIPIFMRALMHHKGRKVIMIKPVEKKFNTTWSNRAL